MIPSILTNKIIKQTGRRRKAALRSSGWSNQYAITIPSFLMPALLQDQQKYQQDRRCGSGGCVGSSMRMLYYVQPVLGMLIDNCSFLK